MTERTLTKEQATQIARDTAEALQAVAAKHDMTVTVNGGKYSAEVGMFTPRIEFAFNDKQERQFRQYALQFGLKPDHFGAKVSANGHEWTIIGIEPRKTKRPIVVKREDGKEFLMEDAFIRKSLDCQYEWEKR